MADETTPGDEPPAEKPKYDQAFFLDLAAKGKDAWNAWRGTANKDVPVTFADVDFSKAPSDEINFAGFNFGNGAVFSLCRWRGINLSYIQDNPNAFSTGCAFFAGATFGKEADFRGSDFGNKANFAEATFGNDANFADAEFQGVANFTRAAFGDAADFTGANFRGEAKFDKTRFEGSVAFNRGRTPFVNISFADTRFEGEANFSGRSFEQTADFTNTRFHYPPDFGDGAKAGKIDFTGARVGFVPAGKWFHWTENSRIPVHLRAFRKIAEETKNHDLERDLYVEERKAERGAYRRQLIKGLEKAPMRRKALIRWRLFIHWLWIVIMALYWALADYGRNFIVPAVWLGLSVPFFYWRYTKVLAPLMHDAGPANADKYNHAIWILAFGNAVPFVGPLTIDAEIKKFLFCPGFGSCLPIPPEGFQLLVIGQNLVSIILIFFIGLALRNYFKIK